MQSLFKSTAYIRCTFTWKISFQTWIKTLFSSWTVGGRIWPLETLRYIMSQRCWIRFMAEVEAGQVSHQWLHRRRTACTSKQEARHCHAPEFCVACTLSSAWSTCICVSGYIYNSPNASGCVNQSEQAETKQQKRRQDVTWRMNCFQANLWTLSSSFKENHHSKLSKKKVAVSL